MIGLGMTGVVPDDSETLYVLAAYLVALLLVLLEIALIHLRGRSIRGHLGWTDGFRYPDAAPSEPDPVAPESDS